MNLLHFVVRSEMNRHISVGSMVIERNWLFTRGLTNDAEIQEEFDAMVTNSPDWSFRKEIFDAENTKIRIFWKRKEAPRINDRIAKALHEGKIFSTSDVV